MPATALSETAALACELVRRPSLTPDDHGCQELLAQRLEEAGFHCRHVPFGEVSNLWARHGAEPPLLVFAGHTDVVPAGPEEHWRAPPFAAHIINGALYGRGAADMKGGVAAMVTACERFVATHPGHRGSVALLITSDEEGPATDGTARVIETLLAENQHIHWCVVGEPSSDERLGDTIKIGRRGSLSGKLRVRGIQGHVGYPHLARNPIHEAGPLIAALAATRWDEGGDGFPPTSFQVSNIHGGTGVFNVIPGAVELCFNFRYAPVSAVEDLQRGLEALCRRHTDDYTLEWSAEAQPFVTGDGELRDALSAGIREITAVTPRTSTAGGTSDGRFIAAGGAQVVEFGVCNATIHQVDEHVAIKELEQSSAVYERVIEKLLGGK